MKLNLKNCVVNLAKIVTLAMSLLSSACIHQVPIQQTSSLGNLKTDSLAIVDCLLPRQVRKLAQNTGYLSGRRPIKIAAKECEIKGGEFVSFDRANYATALKVWLPLAESGDSEAQRFVGEIYEKGIGNNPDYGQAAQWYQKAAEQGNDSARVNLAYLYENGLGVKEDKNKARKLYRQSYEVSEIGKAYIAKKRAILLSLSEQTKKIKFKMVQLHNQPHKKGTVSLRKLQNQLSQNLKKITKLKQEIGDVQKVIERTTSVKMRPAPPLLKLKPTTLEREKKIRSAKYHALIIGNDEYSFLPNKNTTVNDARSINHVLQNHYGYTTTVLLNANRYQILSELHRLRTTLSENDNLLIFYAGHSEIKYGDCYWLPVNSETKNTANWIRTISIADILNTMSSQNILILADACFDNIISSDFANFSGKSSAEFWQTVSGQRSRLAMSASSSSPVMDTGGIRHSVFAEAIVTVLKNSKQEILDKNQFSSQIKQFLQSNEEKWSTPLSLEQGPIKFTGHELGSFFVTTQRIISVYQNHKANSGNFPSKTRAIA